MTIVVPVRFIGTRLILFPFRPESDVVEQVSWRTNVMRSRNQTEQRHALRVRPRQSVDFDIVPGDDVEAARLRNVLFATQTLQMGVPQWWDIRTIRITSDLSPGATIIPCNPDNAMFAADGPAIIVKPDGSGFDVTVESVQAGVSVTLSEGLVESVPVGSEIAPLGTGVIDGVPSYDDHRVNRQLSNVSFLMTSSEDIAFSDAEFASSDFTKHPTDGKLVLDTFNLVQSRFRHRMEFNRTRTDNDLGRILQFPVDVIGTPMRPNRQILHNAAEVWQFKKLVYYLAGSWRSFYMPTFQPDLTFVGPTQDLSSTSLIVEYVGASVAGVQTPHRDVYLRVADGRTYTRRVTAIVDNENGTETLSLASGFEGSTEFVDVDDLVLSWAELVRIDGDVVTFVHERPGKAECRFNVRGVVE